MHTLLRSVIDSLQAVQEALRAHFSDGAALLGPSQGQWHLPAIPRSDLDREWRTSSQ